MIREAIESLVNNRSLTMEESAKTMEDIMSGNATPSQIGAFVATMRLKGETANEVAGMAKVMRDKSLHVAVDAPVVDTCGTGGDSSSTFNISTAASFVIAGAGVKVAKHGNRAMSGTCGSADVLEALDVKIDLSPKGVELCLRNIGVGFMFAQRFHPSMKFAAVPRKEIGIRTVFNMLGPLTNPAGAKTQLIGVSDPNTGALMANVLNILGSHHSLVVHGTDGLDEITLGGNTLVWELKESMVTRYEITPEELGFQRVNKNHLKISGAKKGAEILRNVLTSKNSPTRNVVLINAAGALLAADMVSNLRDGVTKAAAAIDNGSAINKLNSLIELSQTLE